MQPRFVSWAAVSSLPQAKKVSNEEQLRVNREHIQRWDGILIEELVVPGKSRSIILLEDACRQIPQYKRLKELIAKRAFDVLIYLDRSRLGRKSSLIESIVELCHEAGIVTYATESPPPTLDFPERNFAGKMVGAIESVIAQEEVTKMKHRHEIGMMGRVREGNFPNRVPYGWSYRYEIIDDKPVQVVEIDEQAQEAIHLTIELYLRRGLGLNLIADELAERGFLAPSGGSWTRSSLIVMLDMIWRYAGYVELNRRSKRRTYIRAKSRWPALISEADAKAVIAERERRASAKRSVARTHIFSQIVWCQKCNRKMKVGHDRGRVNFRCQDNYGRPTHDKANITLRYIEEAVMAAIDYVQDERNREQLAGSTPDASGSLLRNIERSKERLKKHDEAIQRADDAYVMGTMDIDRYQRQIDRLQEQRKKLEAELGRHERELDIALFDSQRLNRLLEVATVGRAMLQSNDTATANAWFQKHMRVWVQNDQEVRVTVEYL